MKYLLYAHFVCIVSYFIQIFIKLFLVGGWKFTGIYFYFYIYIILLLMFKYVIYLLMYF